jgi:hypothetical protein
LNIMLVPSLPPFDVLRTQGVRRLSAGASIAQAALGHTRRLAAAFLAGAPGEMFTTSTDYGDMNQLFGARGHASAPK